MTSVVWLRMVVIAICASLPIHACAVEQETEDVARHGSELVADYNHKWSSAGNIPVCFLNRSGNEGDAAFVRDLVVREYQNVGICFSGWTRCNDASPCPAIRLYLGVPQGAPGQYAGQSVVGPASCSNRSQWTMWIREDQLDWATVHEFGHALGVHHEHARTDNQGECQASQTESIQQGGGVQYLTAYDRTSVMSYCSGRNRLSSQDVAGLRRFYDVSGPAQCGESCADANPSCEYWASIGECANNPSYMLTNCCRSCDACVDRNSSCAYWASIGECSQNPAYMLTNCCQSCDDCIDSNASCGYWASVGECSRNPGYMLTNCCQSCAQQR